ncbi:xyloglucan O-acetyltransferase 2-like [Phragmites australis]|uniref:xyloglucan O-acetyltransferase 2-like n=1 Tax=Phragmites australis TaxID=29695 RepID=UPI002D7670CA|nr:xyloglucan O-acetyltransferase 2-like [Phragmites australis]
MVTNFLQKYYQLQNHQFLLPKRQFVTYAIYALIALALLHYLLFYPAPASEKPVAVPKLQEEVASVISARVIARGQMPPLSPPPFQGDEVLRNPPPQAEEVSAPPPCDYSDGEWVPDARPPLYNGTSCGTIKDGQNCMAHGRPDTGYLYWRWRPRGCDLPAFSPEAFLRWLRNKHIAFVGDSLARNQAESLLCLLASRSTPELVYRDGEESRFRRWVFREFNATVSIFWSPFLVKVAEKAEHAGVRHNNVFLGAFDERWMSQLGALDAAVLSVGHWFLIPGIYHDGGRVVGCHDCAEFNHTETGFFGAFRDAIHRTLAEVTRRHGHGADGKKVVVLTTFSPAHFEGNWDKAGACPKKRPYRNGEKELGYTETEMRKTVVEAVQAAAKAAGAGAGSDLRFAALDVTTLANLRPDGHPGPYMHNDPFGGGGAGDRVQNDCVHWCMPGPVDTFNEILLQTMLR